MDTQRRTKVEEKKRRGEIKHLSRIRKQLKLMSGSIDSAWMPELSV